MHTSHAKCVINYQRDLVLVCDLNPTPIQTGLQTRIRNTYLGYLTNWADIILWVSDGLYEYSFGLLIDRRGKRRGFIRGDELDPNVVFLQKHCENSQL